MKVIPHSLSTLADNRLLSRYNKKDGNNTIINNLNNVYYNPNKYTNYNSNSNTGNSNENGNLANNGFKGIQI